ncbi:YggT family protein [Glaciihabitans sp. dw_435]|uniref:YggT family protein n=1 Tax=Glaciihabitans sp. dw_435 TaxID=2720081 RepID=UPI001BD451E1|nr:YggT family protein [Glaciihabitans sp. dw_435]
MIIISVILTVVYVVLVVFFILMWARFALDLVSSFNRNFRPRGLGLVLAVFTFSVTDPPLRFVRRFVKPVRLGGASLDFGWSIVMLVVIILMSLVPSIQRALT